LLTKVFDIPKRDGKNTINFPGMKGSAFDSCSMVAGSRLQVTGCR